LGALGPPKAGIASGLWPEDGGPRFPLLFFCFFQPASAGLLAVGRTLDPFRRLEGPSAGVRPA